jgi:predicted aspartyl protease
MSAASIGGNVILAGLLALLSGGVAKAEQPPDCRLKIMAALDMQTIPDGRVTIPVQLDGHDYRMMVDTGGYINTVSEHVVKEGGYYPMRGVGILRGMGTTRLDRALTIKDFIIGHSRGRNFEFYVDDFDSLLADGTLAPQVMGAYDVDFDFAHSKLNLIHPDHCPGIVNYWSKVAPAVVPIEMVGVTHIRVPVTIDGKEINAMLDTGAHTSFITMRAAKRYLGLDEKDPALKLRGNIPINGMVSAVYNYPFQKLSFGDVQVSHPQIQIVEDRVWEDGRDLLLGIGILRQLHLYIAYKEKKMYITPALEN